MLRLFVGNIPHASSPDDLRTWIESNGFYVEAVEIIKDRSTGHSRGFGFVTLQETGTVANAITALNGKLMNGRILTVNRAVPLDSAESFRRTGTA